MLFRVGNRGGCRGCLFVAESEHHNLAALCATGEVFFNPGTVFGPNLAVDKSGHIVMR